MKMMFTVVTLAILLIGLVLLGIGDTRFAIADTSVPNDEVTSSEANNTSATATITIRMYAMADE